MNLIDGLIWAMANLEKRASRLELVAHHHPATIMLTPYGGYAIKAVAGENLYEGEVVYVKITSGADGKVWKAPIDSDMPVGVVYADASANADVYLVVFGIGYVLPTAGVTAARGNVIYVSASTAGRVDQAATLPAVANHNREVGHFLDTGTGNGVKTRAIIHWN